MVLGNKHGLYDAADLIRNLLERQEETRREREAKQFTLRSYAYYHDITVNVAYRRYRRGEIPGAFMARGIITVPADQMTPEVKRCFEMKGEQAWNRSL